MKMKPPVLSVIPGFVLLVLLVAIGFAEEKNRPDQAAGAAAAKKLPCTTVQADYMNWKYEAGVCLLEGNVQLVSDDMKLWCKTMIVYFDNKKGDNEVVKIEAIDAVRILVPKKEAFGDKAVYTRKTDFIILTGDPAILKEGSVNYEASSIGYNVKTKELKMDKMKAKHVPWLQNKEAR